MEMFSFMRLSISFSTMSLGSRYAGREHVSMPPGMFSASKTVIRYPSRESWCAAVIPAGPAPMTATFLPLSCANSGL